MLSSGNPPGEGSPSADKATAGALAKVCEAVGKDQNNITDAHLQEVLAQAVKLYVERVTANDPFPPFPSNVVITATDVMVMATAMLKAVNVQLFELGMWQTWARQ